MDDKVQQSGLQSVDDPLFRKALMLATIYDSKNIEALTNHRNAFVQPDVIESSNEVSDLRNSMLPNSSATCTNNHSCCKCETSNNHSLCKCEKFLRNFAKTQGLVRELSDGDELQSNVRDILSNKNWALMANTNLPNQSDDSKDMRTFQNNEEDLCNSSNVINTDETNNDSVSTNKKPKRPNPKVAEKGSHNEYLPLDVHHKEAILEYGQPFGLQFPIATKVKGKFFGINNDENSGHAKKKSVL